MALCSYDNKLNQKYNFNKEKQMTPTQKKAEVAEAKRVEEEKVTQATEEAEAMHIVDAFAFTREDKKVARRGWSKELKKHFIFTARGQTLPQLSNGKHSSPYTPSIDDVMKNDWFIFGEEG